MLSPVQSAPVMPRAGMFTVWPCSRLGLTSVIAAEEMSREKSQAPTTASCNPAETPCFSISNAARSSATSAKRGLSIFPLNL